MRDRKARCLRAGAVLCRELGCNSPELPCYRTLRALPSAEHAPELALPIPSGTTIYCAKGILTAGTDSHNSCKPTTRFGFDLASSAFDRPHIVVASADGVAQTFGGCPSFDLNHQAKADSCNLGFGNIVRVDHGGGFYTQYAHLSAILVHDGASVVRGQPIGIEGNSGAAGPKHIHWSLHHGDAAKLPTAPTVPMPSISHTGGLVGAFDLPCGDWMQSKQPQKGTLLVSGTAAYESEAQFGFVAARKTTPPSQHLRSSWEYVLWGLSALVLVVGILFRRRRAERLSAGAYAALAVGVAAVVIDFAAFASLRGFPQPLRVVVRLLPVVACVGVFGGLHGWRWSELGLRGPELGWGYWLKLAGVFGIIGSFLVAGYAVLANQLGWALPFGYNVRVSTYLLNGIVIAPLLEEAIYRFALCTPANRAIGKWPTILLSGFVFAELHFIYGNPDPSNFIGGFVLGWVYLQSRSLPVAILFHALGNGFVLATNLVFQHWSW